MIHNSIVKHPAPVPDILLSPGAGGGGMHDCDKKFVCLIFQMDSMKIQPMNQAHPPNPPAPPRHAARHLYERRHQSLLPTRAFIWRQVWHAFVAIGIVAASLGIGVVGYHVCEGMSWIDSLLNASMILGGMGPIGELHTNAGKIFASCYALFSGMIFLAATAVLFAPVFHRFLHKFHLADDGAGRK